MPHVGEQIFESIETEGLIECLKVSETWKILAENVLVKRWKGKMLEACQNGETIIVQLLLERFNNEESGMNIKDKYGYTPFLVACQNGHKDVVQLLLDYSESNIDLNARNCLGSTALIFACKYGHKDVVKLLLDNSKRNINLNARCNKGWTAFNWAVKTGRKDVVELLKNQRNFFEKYSKYL